MFTGVWLPATGVSVGVQVSVRGLYQQPKWSCGLRASWVQVPETGKVWIPGKPMIRLCVWAQMWEGSTLCVCIYMHTCMCMCLSHYWTFLMIEEGIEGNRVRPLVPFELVWVLSVSVTHIYVWSVCPDVFICVYVAYACVWICAYCEPFFGFASLFLWIRGRELQQSHLYQALRFSNSLTLGIIVYASRCEKHTKIIGRSAQRNLDRWPERQTEKKTF